MNGMQTPETTGVFRYLGPLPKRVNRMSVQIREMLENFPELMNLLRGAANASVESVQTGATASSESLIFVSNRQQLKEAANSSAQTWVISKDLAAQVPASVPTVIISPNPYLAMALVGK